MLSANGQATVGFTSHTAAPGKTKLRYCYPQHSEHPKQRWWLCSNSNPNSSTKGLTWALTAVAKTSMQWLPSSPGPRTLTVASLASASKHQVHQDSWNAHGSRSYRPFLKQRKMLQELPCWIAFDSCWQLTFSKVRVKKMRTARAKTLQKLHREGKGSRRTPAPPAGRPL